MPLILQNIYEETKNCYQLKLICGKNGIDRIMNWVYVSEDSSTTSFLRGGELVITTGMEKGNSKEWLYDFITKLIHQNTCGLILNIGRYLSLDDITPKIYTLCETYAYPLFTMPWKIHIYDITRNYYERIFKDTRTSDMLTEAFWNLLQQSDTTHALSLLQQNGYSIDKPYSICQILFEPIEETKSLSQENYRKANNFWMTLHQFLHKNLPNSHLCKTHNGSLIIIPVTDTISSHLTSLLKTLTQSWHNLLSEFQIHVGLGTIVSNLTQLPKSFLHAKSALTMAKAKNELFCSFHDLGFYRILLSVNDIDLLKSYCEEKLGKIKTYDTNHGGCYLETLYQYLLHQGSVLKVAKIMYCHRNTVNYRIHVLKETLSLDIDKTEVRFELLAAFHIENYLKSIEKS